MKKNVIRILCLVLALASLLSVAAFAAEDSGPAVRVNGQLVDFPDAKPYIDENDRTLIPVRFVTESLGAKVDWDGSTRTVTIAKSGTTVNIQIDSPILTVTTESKEAKVEMDTAAVIRDSRTYVPIRFVAEALGAKVDYSDTYRTVGIWSDKLSVEQMNKLQAYDHTAPDRAITYAQAKDNFEADDLAYYYGDRSGFATFANAREHLYQTVSGKGKYGFPGLKKNLENTDSDTLFQAIIDEAVADINLISERVTVSFVTDASCLYQGDGMDRTTACVRGIIQVKLHVLPTELMAEEVALLCRLGFHQVQMDRTLCIDVDVHMNTQPDHKVNIHSIVPLCDAYEE